MLAAADQRAYARRGDAASSRRARGERRRRAAPRQRRQSCFSRKDRGVFPRAKPHLAAGREPRRDDAKDDKDFFVVAELVAQGGGALGAALEADMRSGAGAAQAGKGLGAYLHSMGAVETGQRAENEQ